jgi:hypothetical protein
MVTVYIICFGFEKSYILSTQYVCTFQIIITTRRLYFPCSMNTGRFLRIVSQIFHYFRPFACLCVETHASLSDTLLGHGSYSTLPIFVILVEHLALMTTKYKIHSLIKITPTSAKLLQSTMRPLC